MQTHLNLTVTTWVLKLCNTRKTTMDGDRMSLLLLGELFPAIPAFNSIEDPTTHSGLGYPTNLSESSILLLV